MKTASFIAAGILVASTSAAQTSDVVYGSWTWSATVVGARGQGLAGAQVAIVDDASALALNPAVLSSLTSTEGFGNGFQTPAATIGRGDENASRAGIGITGGGGLITPKLAIGGFIVQPRSIDTHLAEGSLPNGSHLSGSLRSVVTDAGGGAAMRLSSRLHVGVQVVATHLELEGQGSRFSEGREVLRMGTSSGSTRVVAVAGVLVEVNRSLSLGASAMSGTTYTADRTALNPSLPLTLDAGSEYQVQRPSRASVGASWTVVPRLHLVGQVDYIGYAKIRETTRLADAAGPTSLELDNALEPRGAAELSIPFRNTASLQLRAGLHSRAPASLRSGSADATIAATFPGGERKLETVAGATVIVSTFSFHAAYTGGNTPLFAFGGSLRF